MITTPYGSENVRPQSRPLRQRDRGLTQERGHAPKPAPEAAPSCEAVVGRYILHPSVFEDLARQGPGAGGEIQLTDAITAGASRLGLAGFRFSGERFDCGSKQGMLQAILHIASQDPDYAEVMEAFRAAGPLQSAA
jgi:UTP--glucose-1-phosphate uridylyltransferase